MQYHLAVMHRLYVVLCQTVDQISIVLYIIYVVKIALLIWNQPTFVI